MFWGYYTGITATTQLFSTAEAEKAGWKKAPPADFGQEGLFGQ